MRLRIVKRMEGDIDGVALGHFHVGQTYEVGTTLGSYLLALGAAVPVIDNRPVAVIPIDTKSRRSKAADATGKTQRKRR